MVVNISLTGKKTSMIGKDYQVSSVPKAGKYNVTGGNRM
jgi:hypothetical protein